MQGLPSPPIKGISLLFLKVADVTPPDNKYVNGLDIIYAIEKVTGRGSIEGAQRMGNLFRIYVKNESAKNKLSIEGFTFQGHQVSLFTHNPFTVKEHSSETVKIIIGGVPLSVAHDEFEKALLDLKVEMVSDIKFENYRDSEGKWTNYKTGRRFVYCRKPSLNLKTNTKVGFWNATLYYRGQIRPQTPQHQTEIKVVNTEEGIPSKGTEELEICSDNISTSPSGSTHVPTNKKDGDKPGMNSVEDAVASRDQIIPLEVTVIDKGVRSKFSGKNQNEKTKVAPPTPPKQQSNASSQNRQGRSKIRTGANDSKQKHLDKMFNRNFSTSIPRSKRYHETSPKSPVPPKSNARSKSRQTDWYEETGEADLC